MARPGVARRGGAVGSATVLAPSSGDRAGRNGPTAAGRATKESTGVSLDSERKGGSERRAEILDTAATLFASSGLRTSLQRIADACGILPGSLYHHFESKEDISVALIERYQAELDDIAAKAVGQGPNPHLPGEQIVALGTAIAGCAVRHRAALLLTLYEPPAGASAEMCGWRAAQQRRSTLPCSRSSRPPGGRGSEPPRAGSSGLGRPSSATAPDRGCFPGHGRQVRVRARLDAGEHRS
jgi:AcrR family transcriptional regulator